MEGAGTTAYDGSGNGNDGTIDGATWVSGIGAPVAQTALVSWNKGSNLVPYSEQFDNAGWSKTRASVTANAATSPDGYANADAIIADSVNDDHFVGQNISVTNATAYSFSAFLKKGNKNWARLWNTSVGYADFDLTNGVVGTQSSATGSIENFGNGWYRCTILYTASSTSAQTHRIYTLEGDNNKTFAGDGLTTNLYVYGAQLEAVDSLGPYIPTLSTAQTSPVLLPQGLTANKDITGVNAFESARNPYALNLDGKSWAEVHDNASLDITSAITLEAWVYWDNSPDKGLMGKWDYNSSKASYLLYKQSASRFIMYVSSNGSALTNQQNVTSISNGWNHLVGVYDGANLKCYLNGVLDGSIAYSSGIYSSDAVVEIGRYDEVSSTSYTNQLAQPRIYNRALTATEVARNYNADKSKFGL